MKKYSTIITLSISLIYALLAPVLFPGIDFFWFTTGLLALIAIFSKTWVDVAIVVFVQLNMLSHLFMYPELPDYRHLAQVFAFSAYVLLCFTLIMGPLARQSKHFAKILVHRRHVGVAVFLLGLTHFGFIIAQYYDLDPSLIYSVKTNFFGSTALFILGGLALTSTDYAKNKISLKSYSILHTGFLIFYLLYATTVILFTEPSFTMWQLFSLGVFVIFWLALAPWTFPSKLFERVNGWKQFHYLVYIAFTALFLHAWFGFFVDQLLPVQMSFWAMTNAVILAHAYGWYTRWRKSKSTKSNQ